MAGAVLLNSFGRLFDQENHMLLLPCPLLLLQLIENHHGHITVKKLTGNRLNDPCSKGKKGDLRDTC